MTSAMDVGAYLLAAHGPTEALALQKLLYYAQCWCSAETGSVCFGDTIEAWRNGPVVRNVWEAHARRSIVSELDGDPSQLIAAHQQVIDDVLVVYGPLRGDELVETTHAEPGWLHARRGLAPGDRGDHPIDIEKVVRFLRQASGATRRERMASALSRAQERAQLRAVLEPHRATMLRLAQ